MDMIALSPVDLGLGKSKMAIDITTRAFMRGQVEAVLVIAPNGVHRQWIDEEYPAHCPVPYRAAYYSPKNRAAERKKLEEVLTEKSNVLRVVAVNYDTFSTIDNWKPFVDFVKLNRTAIVVDESHNIKDPTSKRTKTIIREFCDCTKRGRQIVKAVPFSVMRIIMTGTPIGNSPLDLWSEYEFLKPNFFEMNFQAFKHRYGLFYKRHIYVNGREVQFDARVDRQVWSKVQAFMNYDEAYSKLGVSRDIYEHVKAHGQYEGSYRNIEELKSKIAPVNFSWTKEQCLDLPDKIYEKRMLDMSPKQAAFYNTLKEELLVQLENKLVSVTSSLSLLTRLRQVTSGFVPMKTLEENGDITIAQEPVDTTNVKLNTMIDDIEGCRFPCMVITQFTAEANFLYDILQKRFPDNTIGLNTGSRKCWSGDSDEKRQITDVFKAGGIDILIANQATICNGFNFQICSFMFIYSNSFSFIQRSQLEGRLHRIGTLTSPTYVDYIYRKTVDEKLYQAQQSKKELATILQDTSLVEFLKD
jgi:SNF2 family DNA or RNA helicase